MSARKQQQAQNPLLRLQTRCRCVPQENTQPPFSAWCKVGIPPGRAAASGCCCVVASTTRLPVDAITWTPGPAATGWKPSYSTTATLVAATVNGTHTYIRGQHASLCSQHSNADVTRFSASLQLLHPAVAVSAAIVAAVVAGSVSTHYDCMQGSINHPTAPDSISLTCRCRAC